MKTIISILAIVALTLGSCKKSNSTSPAPTSQTVITHQTEVYIVSSGSKNFYINNKELIAYQNPTTYVTKTGDILRCKADAYHGNAYNVDNVAVLIYVDGVQVFQQMQYSNIDITYTVQ
jgi:hypothetical protein